MDAVRSEGRVIGSKVSAVKLEEIKKLVASGNYLNTSDFLRDAIRDKLAAIKTIKYRDVDYETARRKLWGTSRIGARLTLTISRKSWNVITI